MGPAAQLAFDFRRLPAIAAEPAAPSPAPCRTRDPLRTRGVHHDLRALFDAVNARHFGGSVDAALGWGRPAPRVRGRRRPRSISLGTYDYELKLVRVHPALDQEFVPRFYVEYILFHEMLHHVMPAPVIDGRRRLHSPAFRARERAYPDYARTVEWEQRCLRRLLNG